LAGVERHAGRLYDSLKQLNDAADIVDQVGPWATGRYHLELATVLKNLAIAEARNDFFEQALANYQEALYEFEAIGNHRLKAIVENNHGYLLLSLKRINEAEHRLVLSRKLFDRLDDKVRGAQVDETLAQLHVADGRLDLAEQVILQAVESLAKGGEEALLSEALTTHGVVLFGLGRHREAKRVLERSNRIAESCGDQEGAGRALLLLIEEMCEELDDYERVEIGSRLEGLLAHSQHRLTLERLRKCHERIANASARNDTRLKQR
jgi:tetratricopeptide (TPR) repeat protein